MPNLELLGGLMRDLHTDFTELYYILLPVFFALAVALAWFRNPQGSPEFLDILKRAIISTLLLVAFPEITRCILFLADGITERIDKLSGIDAFIRMAKEKSETYSLSVTSVLIQFNDLLIATLSFLSYLILYFARSITFAMYHFFWVFYSIAAPLLLLFNLFPATSKITINLFKGMIEVACWKIVWAILGAMLTALSFGDAYQVEGGYVTLMVMNFVIAVAMLATPLVVSSLVGSGLNSVAPLIGAAAVSAMTGTPVKVAAVNRVTRQSLNATKTFAQKSYARAFPKNTRNNIEKGHS